MQLLGFSIPVISEEALESDPLDPESFRGKWLLGNISCAVICRWIQHGLDKYNPLQDLGVAKALQQHAAALTDDLLRSGIFRSRGLPEECGVLIGPSQMCSSASSSLKSSMTSRVICPSPSMKIPLRPSPTLCPLSLARPQTA